jgi:excisionase family DNA binding protein
MPGGVSPAGEFISAEELSQWLVLGKTRTWELLASGEIPSYKIGRLRRIKKADVERYLEARRYDPKGATASGPPDIDGDDSRGGSA